MKMATSSTEASNRKRGVQKTFKKLVKKSASQTLAHCLQSEESRQAMIQRVADSLWNYQAALRANSRSSTRSGSKPTDPKSASSLNQSMLRSRTSLHAQWHRPKAIS